MLEHGGRLREAASRHGIALGEWLDLSTGINPAGYPVPPLDPAWWRRLPEEGDGLEAAAAAYYGTERLAALPGSQAGIQLLPALLPPGTAACVAPLYGEHPLAWTRAGHRLLRAQAAEPAKALAQALAAQTPYVVLCNPNNPTAHTLPREALIEAAAELRGRRAWLIVDEAFGDADPDNCMAPLAGGTQAPNLVVLRSLGKFFGLAGARVGFAFAAPKLLDRLREALGPWPVSGPARVVARQALSDGAWQAECRRRLATAAARLTALLRPLGEATATSLFATVRTDAAGTLYEHLARRAILTRCFPDHGLLRFGLPGAEADWQRLATAFDAWEPKC